MTIVSRLFQRYPREAFCPLINEYNKSMMYTIFANINRSRKQLFAIGCALIIVLNHLLHLEQACPKSGQRLNFDQLAAWFKNMNRIRPAASMDMICFMRVFLNTFFFSIWFMFLANEIYKKKCERFFWSFLYKTHFLLMLLTCKILAFFCRQFYKEKKKSMS